MDQGFPSINPALLEYSNKTDSIQVFWEKIYDHDWAGAEVIVRSGHLEQTGFISHQPEAGVPINFQLPSDFAELVRDQLTNTWPLPLDKTVAIEEQHAKKLLEGIKQQILTLEEKDSKLLKLIKDELNKHSHAHEKVLGKNFMACLHGAEHLYDLFSKESNWRSAGTTITEVLKILYWLYDTYIYIATKAMIKSKKGWETRSNPITIKHNGKPRILLPLYSDKLNFSLILYSDDDGVTWNPSPILSRAGIQPCLVQKKEGEIVAYMRNNGGILNLDSMLLSKSSDCGESWSNALPALVVNSSWHLKNHSSSLAVYKLPYGQDGQYKNSWVLAYNPDDHRKTLQLALSEDEGETWSYRVLKQGNAKDDGNTFEYPSITQAPSGHIILSYSYFAATADFPQGKKAPQTIQTAIVEPAWIKGKN